MKISRLIICATLCAIPFALCHAGDAPVVATPRWDAETLQLLATLPVQEGGRVKPLDTFAGFKLLKLNGKRVCLDNQGNKLAPTEWLANTLFFPETSKQYKIFRIYNPDVLTALGLTFPDKPRRGPFKHRYSYNDLAPGRGKLLELATQYGNLDAKQRTPAQRQIINLAFNLREFEELADYLHWARHRFPQEAFANFEDIFPAQETPRSLSAVLAQAPSLVQTYRHAQHADGQDARFVAADKLLREIYGTVAPATALALFPPSFGATEWLTPAGIVNSAFAAETALSTELEIMAALEDAAAMNAPALMKEKLRAFHFGITEVARNRGEYGSIELEVAYYRAKPFYYSLVLYALSFVLVALSWTRPRSRLLNIAGPAMMVPPTLILMAGIVARCIIRARPPVTTLYESILFITLIAVVASLVVEYINRQKIMLTVGAFVGILGLFLAYKYEAAEGSDTMPSMVAVLDTNFWLAAHVTTIVIGQAAGLLAGVVSHVYIVLRLCRIKSDDRQFYAQFSRTVYGMLCFALLFSVVGTVLGGIWANESWGRFWGWDPKENGALMIVLWQLAILHARLGGYIREYGLHLASIVGMVIIIFCRFGVNMLGVGLHSYGFSSGGFRLLMIFYLVEAVVLFIGFTLWLVSRSRKARVTSAA